MLSLKNPSFIPNVTTLGMQSCAGEAEEEEVKDGTGRLENKPIITELHMGGKLTLSRQVVLGAILAQIDCVVTSRKCDSSATGCYIFFV